MSTVGINEPVEAGAGDTKTVAWRNMDDPTAAPNFHVIVQVEGQDDLELLGLTPDRIKDLGQQFLEIHNQIVESK